MKRIIILLLILMLLSGCTVKPGNSAGTKSSASPPTLSGRYESPLALENIFIDIDAYFRMYYANNQNYKWNRVAAVQRSIDGSYVTGYFDGDSLIKMVLETYGETKSNFTTYYFINERLIYCVHRSNHQFPPPFQESYDEYFLMEGKLWQYNCEQNNLIESSDTYVTDYYEKDIYALIGDKAVSFVESTCTLPAADNAFIQFNNAKNIYFRKFFAKKQYDLFQNSFHVDLLNSYSLPETEKINALFNDTEPYLLRLGCSEEMSYTGYEYYLIDDTRIYVVVYYQEFENCDAEFNDMRRNNYKEYFIIDDKVKIYDPEKQDLMDSPGSGQILEHFQKVKSVISEGQTANDGSKNAK